MMAFSEFSLTAGATVNPDALVEQWCAFNYLFNAVENAVLDMQAQVGNFNILLFSNINTADPPAVMMLLQPGNIYVYIGGTNLVVSGNVGNVVGAMAPAPFGAGVSANRWIVQMAQLVNAQIQAELPPNWQTYRMHFYGHSQGGAIAELLACSYPTQYRSMPCDVIKVGGPKVFSGAPVPAPNLPRYGFGVTNFGDPVPMLPANTVNAVIGLGGLALPVYGDFISWAHISPTLVIKTDWSFVYVNPADPYFTLTPGLLFNVGNTHPFPVYSNSITSWWEANFA